jgi:hypothetical protein
MQNFKALAPGEGFTAYGGAYSSTSTTSYDSSAPSRISSNSSRSVHGRRLECDLDKIRNRDSFFRHPPIDFTRRQIRLVQVLPTESVEPIKCKFALSMVPNKSVRYTAWSYTWGGACKELDVVKIVLHKQEFWARRNLWWFLRQVRDDPALRSKWYWIDALCTDQAETGSDGHQEKNHQVNMMSQIYSNANLVVTWLENHDQKHAKCFNRYRILQKSRASSKIGHPYDKHYAISASPNTGPGFGSSTS